jgi:hypothetical protein
MEVIQMGIFILTLASVSLIIFAMIKDINSSDSLLLISKEELEEGWNKL